MAAAAAAGNVSATTASSLSLPAFSETPATATVATAATTPTRQGPDNRLTLRPSGDQCPTSTMRAATTTNQTSRADRKEKTIPDARSNAANGRILLCRPST